MNAIAWGTCLGMLIAYPIFADIGVSNEVRKAGTSPMKKYYASASGSLSLIDFGLKSASIVSSTTDSSLQINTLITDDIDQADVEPKITNKPLNYPNPFKKSQTTTLYYSLSKSMDIEIRIYDMMANELVKVQKPAGLIGSSMGPNKISIVDLGLEPQSLSAGVYFYIIMNNGLVLGKGKMALIP